MRGGTSQKQIITSTLTTSHFTVHTYTYTYTHTLTHSFYTPQALAALNKEVDNNLGHVRHTARSKCLRGVPSMIPFLELSRLASLCSDLVGVRVCPHALKQEWTHVNVQVCRVVCVCVGMCV